MRNRTSRIEAGKLQLVEEPMPLAEVIESTLDALRPYGDQHNVMVHLRLHPGLPTIVRGDPGRIRQIVMNLLVNAALAIDGVGRITLRTGGDNDWAWLEVRSGLAWVRSATLEQLIQS